MQRGDLASVRINFERANGQRLPKDAHIRLRSRGWAWKVALRDFEVIHGFSRIVRLVPDKLHTAKAIELEIGKGRGEFLCKLVEDLIILYRDIHKEKQISADNYPEQRLPHEMDETLNKPIAHNASLGETIDEYLHLLRSVKESLNDPEGAYEDRARSFVQMSDDLLQVCHIFLDFIHPVWITVRRTGVFDNQLIASLKVRCDTKLMQCYNKLCLEYSWLETRSKAEAATRAGNESPRAVLRAKAELGQIRTEMDGI